MAQTNAEVIKITEKLIDSNHDLQTQVDNLAGRLSAKEVLHHRTRRLTVFSMIIGLISLLGFGFTSYVVYQNRQNAEVIANNAKVSCENANDTRNANKQIWLLVIDSSGRDDKTVLEKENTQIFREYIKDFYAARDCNDLDRRYTPPDPPKFKF